MYSENLYHAYVQLLRRLVKHFPIKCEHWLVECTHHHLYSFHPQTWWFVRGKGCGVGQSRPPRPRPRGSRRTWTPSPSRRIAFIVLKHNRYPL